jgi:hypothetical protein
MSRTFLIALCISLVTLIGCQGKLTSDDELIKRFHDHRTNFEKIVQMMNEDTNVRSIYEGHVWLDDTHVWQTDEQKGFSTARWNQYKELFPQLGSPNIHRISKKGDIIEIASGSVVVYDTDDPYEKVVTSKGYAYSLNEPSPLVSSLDDPEMNPSYKRIAGNWYLYFSSGISKPE